MPTASTISRLPLDEDRVVSAGSIRVNLVYVANSTASPASVAFLDNNDIPVLNMTVPALDSESFPGVWLADNGLKVSGLSDAGVIVTVLHSQDGA